MANVTGDLSTEADVVRVRGVELKKGDSPQRYREKLARIVMDEMYQFVGLLDASGTLLEVNRAALEGAGIRLDDIMGKPFWEARWWTVSQETMDEQREACRRGAMGEFIRYDVEIYGEAAGEGTIIIDYSLNPVKNQEGKVVFLLAEGRNITEKKRAEAEIARKNEELQRLLNRVRELDELKSQFFANVSHELRTPLALILGPTEKVLAADNLTDAQRQDIDVVRRNAAMLLKQVNNLLDLSKLDAGKMTADYSSVDLVETVRTVAGQFDGLAPQRNINYTVLTPSTLPAEIDVDKIERVVLNLVSNAFKFVPDGGRVSCTLEAPANGRALLTIKDSGPGVPPDLRDAIFQRFRQADGGATRQAGGTGLGLSIVRDFVDLHCGTVSVTEAPGGGAQFMVELPLHARDGVHVRRRAATHPQSKDSAANVAGALEELMPAAVAVTPDVAAAEGQARILVVEDNADLRNLIAGTLSGDYSVKLAADGGQGLELALAEKPDLIITDLMMPGMSGDQMIEALRQREDFDDVPIIVLSAKADDSLRVRLLANGAQDYLVKPFAGVELRARTANLVSVKRATDLLRQEADSKTADIELLAAEVAQRNRELVQTAEDLRRANSDKEVLLQEVNHRVKNSLQIVVGLLTLQARQISDEQARSMLEEARVRVGVVASLHQRLYQTSAHDRLEITSFAVELAKAVLSSMGADERIKLEVLADGEEIFPISDAVPLALILSELVTNAAKHGFEATEPGKLIVGFERVGGEIRVRVKDEGRGLPEGFDPKRSSGIGMKIITALASQLRAKFTVEPQGRGASFLLALPPR